MSLYLNRLVLSVLYIGLYWGIFLYIATSHCTKFHYNRSIFGIDVLLINGTVPEKHCKFSAVSQLQIEGCK